MGIFIIVYFTPIQKHSLKNKQASVWEYVAPNLHKRPTKGATDLSPQTFWGWVQKCASMEGTVQIIVKCNHRF